MIVKLSKKNNDLQKKRIFSALVKKQKNHLKNNPLNKTFILFNNLTLNGIRNF